MDRLEAVRQVVDEIVRQQPDREESRCGFVHLYGVAAVCALLAIKRRQDAQLAAVAGMLHDIWSYKTGDDTDHARLSALEAGRILGELGLFTPEETALVSRAIAHHSTKDQVDGELDELLKDADILHHYLYNPGLQAGRQQSERLKRVVRELGLARAQP